MHRRRFLLIGAALAFSGSSCDKPTCAARAARALQQTLNDLNAKSLDALLPLVGEDSRPWVAKVSSLAKNADRTFDLELPDKVDPGSLMVVPGSPPSARASLIRPPAVRQFGLRTYQQNVLVFLGNDTHLLPPEHGELVAGLTASAPSFAEQLQTLPTLQQARLPNVRFEDGKEVTLVAYCGLNIEPGRIDRVEVVVLDSPHDEHENFSVTAWERSINAEVLLSESCDHVVQLRKLNGLPVAEFFKQRVAAHRLDSRKQH